MNEKVASFYQHCCYMSQHSIRLLQTETSLLLHRNLMLACYLSRHCCSNKHEWYAMGGAFTLGRKQVSSAHAYSRIFSGASHRAVITVRVRMNPER